MLLTADLHLDENPDHEYRWEVFTALKSNAQFKSRVGILGDMTDNRDKFSSTFVNRLVAELLELRKCGVRIDILMGNHDAPVKGVPYWTFLNHIEGIQYYTEPTFTDHWLWLPWANNPAEAWHEVDLTGASVVFLHQLLTGAIIRGRTMESKIPIHLPGGPQYYAGDIHEPQRVKIVHYVGAPHPVDFGDEHECHLTEINDISGRFEKSIVLNPVRKWTVVIRNTADLTKLKNISAGDQVKVTVKIDAANASNAPTIEAAVRQWGESKQVKMPNGIDFALELGNKTMIYNSEVTDPNDILTEFAKAEGIEGPLLDAGRRLLKEVGKK